MHAHGPQRAVSVRCLRQPSVRQRVIVPLAKITVMPRVQATAVRVLTLTLRRYDHPQCAEGLPPIRALSQLLLYGL